MKNYKFNFAEDVKMFFSVEYPEIMERVEEKLKKQVEDKGFDFEAIKKIVGASIARL